MNKENNSVMNKRYYGITVIKSENSNWNADFSGFPRRLPDDNSTIYATDKALKYAIRKYWNDKKQNVFVWKSHKESIGNEGEIKIVPRKLDERFLHMQTKLLLKEKSFPEEKVEYFAEIVKKVLDLSEKLTKEKKQDEKDKISKEIEVIYSNCDDLKENKENKEKIESIVEQINKASKDQKHYYEVFSQCLDVKLFGITYAGDTNISITGPAQISYGVNKYKDNTVYSNQILSPYRNDKEKTSSEGEKETKESDASTLGSEIKALECYYVYDFVINPKNLTDHIEGFFGLESDINMNLTNNDIDLFKEAINRCASNLRTSSKFAENVFTFFVAVNDDKLQLPTLKNYISIYKQNNDGLDKICINIKELQKLLGKYNNSMDVEIFCCPGLLIDSEPAPTWEIKDILKDILKEEQ